MQLVFENICPCQLRSFANGPNKTKPQAGEEGNLLADRSVSIFKKHTFLKYFAFWNILCSTLLTKIKRFY